jgi:microcompartment protein CcmL/EutN
MMALGLIETVGLSAAITVADAAVKSANVSLIGYENTNGEGLITVKVQGDVGAVKAAVAAASAAAKSVGEVYSVHVIPRPALGIGKLISSENNEAPSANENSPEPETANVEVTVESVESVEEESVEVEIVEDSEVKEHEASAQEESKNKKGRKKK